MILYRTRRGIVIEQTNQSAASDFFLSAQTDWTTYINRDDLYEAVTQELSGLTPNPDAQTLLDTDLLPPIDQQEIWASGVTYLRSREARMEEANQAGGSDFYARVYDAERPELFFKATAYRTVGSGQPVRLRQDSQWNVPEPELTLFMASSGRIVGYTVGNDMSSRDIEGENPLYLPQAKTYDGSAAIGPGLYVPAEPISLDTRIQLVIRRAQQTVFDGSISLRQMKRSLTELAAYLFRECTFPAGAFLMTGTGIVPPNDFTLQSGDEIRITIEAIGTLINTVH